MAEPHVVLVTGFGTRLVGMLVGDPLPQSAGKHRVPKGLK